MLRRIAFQMASDSRIHLVTGLVENCSEENDLQWGASMCAAEKGRGNTEWVVGEIMDYLSEKDLRYAVAIEGEWGSGKTRFLKTKLAERLDESGIDVRIVYVSLFGVSGADEFYRRAIAARLSLGDSGDSKVKGAIKQLFKTMRSAVPEGLQSLGILPKVSLSIDPESIAPIILSRKCLLIIDDTERRGKDCDDLSLFGAVNDLVENKGIKTILVSNSFQPTCHDADEGKGFDSEIREKLVWRCLRFRPSMEDIVADVFPIPAGSCFDPGKRRAIVQAAQSIGCRNVRALLKAKRFIEGLMLADDRYSGDIAVENRRSALQELIGFALLICLNKRPAKPEKIDYAKIDFMEAFRLQSQEDQYTRFSSFECFGEYFDVSDGPSTTRLSEGYRQYLEKWYPQNKDTFRLSELANKFAYIEGCTDEEAGSLMAELCEVVARENFAAECIPKTLVAYYGLREIGFDGLDSDAFLRCCSNVISKDGGSVYEDLDRALRIGQVGPCQDAMERLRDEALAARERRIADTGCIDLADPACGEMLARKISDIVKVGPAKLTEIDPEFISRVFSASSPMGQRRIRELLVEGGGRLRYLKDDGIEEWLRALVEKLEELSLDRTGTMRKKWTVGVIRQILGDEG